MVARVAARDAPESWSWVEQVSAAAADDDDANDDDDADDKDYNDNDDDDDDDVRAASPQSRTRSHVGAAPTSPPWPPLTRACGR